MEEYAVHMKYARDDFWSYKYHSESLSSQGIASHIELLSAKFQRDSSWGSRAFSIAEVLKFFQKTSRCTL